MIKDDEFDAWASQVAEHLGMRLESTGPSAVIVDTEGHGYYLSRPRTWGSNANANKSTVHPVYPKSTTFYFDDQRGHGRGEIGVFERFRVPAETALKMLAVFAAEKAGEAA